MTLRNDDDANAVLAVLDRLSSSLETNRTELENVLRVADTFGGGGAVPTQLLNSIDDTEITKRLKSGYADCVKLREQLESAIDSVFKALSMLTEVAETQQRRQLAAHEEYAVQLRGWQEKVMRAETERSELLLEQAKVHRQLGILYKKLSSS